MRSLRPSVVLIIGALLLISLLPLALGSEVSDVSDERFFKEIGRWAVAYNGYIDNLPPPLQHVKCKECINCEITMSDGGTTRIGVIFSGPRIICLQKGPFVKPSATVLMKEKTMREIIKSDSPVKAVAEALRNGDITYQADGWRNRIKYWLFERMIMRSIG